MLFVSQALQEQLTSVVQEIGHLIDPIATAARGEAAQLGHKVGTQDAAGVCSRGLLNCRNGGVSQPGQVSDVWTSTAKIPPPASFKLLRLKSTQHSWSGEGRSSLV